MTNFISLKLISLFRLLIYNDYIYGATVTIFMWSLNPSDKLAGLGSMAVEEPKVCNCYCFYQFLLQPSLNFLALCTSDKSLLNCACRSTFIFDCSIDVLQIMALHVLHLFTFPFLTYFKIWGDWTWHTQHKMTKWKLLCNFTYQGNLQAQTSVHRR